jgi:hypothetical protein
MSNGYDWNIRVQANAVKTLNQQVDVRFVVPTMIITFIGSGTVCDISKYEKLDTRL